MLGGFLLKTGEKRDVSVHSDHPVTDRFFRTQQREQHLRHSNNGFTVKGALNQTTVITPEQTINA
jgi:hypothetical protein